jgi:hypothetical protein
MRVLVALIVVAITVDAGASDSANVSLSDLPNFYRKDNYNVAPYIGAAVALQSVDRAEALQRHVVSHAT